jgi:hypothetical protein
VAEAYGLNREQYAHILSTFSHRNYPKAPNQCLAAFDELKSIGLDAFTKKHDPYWDIPLNENLPQPVIDLPILNSSAEPSASARRKGSAWNVSEEASHYGLPFDEPSSESPTSPSQSRQEVAEGHTHHRGRPAAGLDDQVFGRIKALLRERGNITSTDAQALTGLDATAVRPYLLKIIADGLATQEGQRRGTTYRLKQ